MNRTVDYLALIRLHQGVEDKTRQVLADGRKAGEVDSLQSQSAATKRRQRSEQSAFLRDASQLHQHMVQFEVLLRANRPAYLAVNRHVAVFGVGAPLSMSEQDRDEWDTSAREFLVTCKRKLDLLQATQSSSPASQQVGQRQEHEQSIVTWLRDHLKSTAGQIQRMQAARVERWEQQRPQWDTLPQIQTTSATASTTTSTVVPTTPSPKSANSDHRMTAHLSARDRLVLEQENDTLLAELSGVEEQVRQAEKSLLEIGQLQFTLEQHVVTQHEQITQIYSTTVQTTEQIRGGNVALGKATRRGVEFRNFMLLFFLVLAFILLFLHYYEQ